MKRKNMAHPKLRTKILARLPLIFAVGIIAFAALLSSIDVPSVSAASASNCTNSMKTVFHQDAAKQAVTELRGPAYATIWVNYNAVPSDAAWNIARKNPSWGQKEVKIKIPWGVEVKAFWAGGTFVKYSRNADCQARMTKEFSADTRPEKSLDTMEQWGLLLYMYIGKS